MLAGWFEAFRDQQECLLEGQVLPPVRQDQLGGWQQLVRRYDLCAGPDLVPLAMLGTESSERGRPT